MKTASAYILYTPLTIALQMDMIGGSTSQIKDKASGSFSPNRQLTPLQLKPRLFVNDPDMVMSNGEHTDKLVDCRWYIGTDDTGIRITSLNTNYVIGDNGELTVKRNVDPDETVALYFSCAFIDPRTQNIFRKSYQVTLTASTACDINLGISIDAARKLAISPYTNYNERTITATLRNGENDVDDDAAVFTWLVLDNRSNWREITEDDIFYVSGQGTKALTIDRRYIDKEYIRVEAYLKTVPDTVVSTMTMAYLYYGRWSETENIVRGKYIRSTTKEVEILGKVETPKGNLATPSDYFDMTHIFTTNMSGAKQTVIGYGESVTVDASIAGKDPNVVPVFGLEVKERSAYRAAQVDGKDVYINGQLMCLKVPK